MKRPTGSATAVNCLVHDVPLRNARTIVLAQLPDTSLKTSCEHGLVCSVCRPRGMVRRVYHWMSVYRKSVRQQELHDRIRRRSPVFREAFPLVLGRHIFDRLPELGRIPRSCCVSDFALLRLHAIPVETDSRRIPKIRKRRTVYCVPIVAAKLVKIENMRSEEKRMRHLLDFYNSPVLRGDVNSCIRLSKSLYALVYFRLDAIVPLHSVAHIAPAGTHDTRQTGSTNKHFLFRFR